MNIYTFSQVVVWIAGNITYLFVIFLLLYYFYALINKKYNQKVYNALLLLLNFIIPMFVEHTGVILIIGNLLILFYEYFSNQLRRNSHEPGQGIAGRRSEACQKAEPSCSCLYSRMGIRKRRRFVEGIRARGRRKRAFHLLFVRFGFGRPPLCGECGRCGFCEGCHTARAGRL